MRGGGQLLGTLDILDGDGERVAHLQAVRAVRKVAQSNLGALQVGEDGHRGVECFAGPSQVLVGGVVNVVITVAHIQASHIHSGLNGLGEVLVRGNSRANGGHDLRSTHG